MSRYLTRLHYCAADTASGPPGAQWGEHEIDYILFAQADVSVDPNPDEVAATRYVTEPELRKMMAPESGLSWSPWFRIIATNFLSKCVCVVSGKRDFTQPRDRDQGCHNVPSPGICTSS